MEEVLILLGVFLVGLLVAALTFELGNDQGYKRGRKEGMEHTAKTLRENGVITERMERITKEVAKSVWGGE